MIEILFTNIRVDQCLYVNKTLINSVKVIMSFRRLELTTRFIWISFMKILFNFGLLLMDKNYSI